MSSPISDLRSLAKSVAFGLVPVALLGVRCWRGTNDAGGSVVLTSPKPFREVEADAPPARREKPGSLEAVDAEIAQGDPHGEDGLGPIITSRHRKRHNR
jgi:hypothetical protein